MTRRARGSTPSTVTGPSGPAVAPAAARPVATPRARNDPADEREDRDQRGADDQHGGDGQSQHTALDAIALERPDRCGGHIALRAPWTNLLRVRLRTVLHGPIIRLGRRWRPTIVRRLRECGHGEHEDEGHLEHGDLTSKGGATQSQCPATIVAI